MGCEVFYQVTLISILIRSTELTSKREGNCNVMILRPTDYGLHMIQSRLNLIFTASAMSSSLYHFIVITTSSPLYRLGHKSALALSGTEVLHVAYKPNDRRLMKTTCRPTPFWTRPGLTLGMLISASTIHHTT